MSEYSERLVQIHKLSCADGRTDGGRTGGRTGGRRADGRTDGRKGRFEAQVPIFTAQMKKASKKCQKNTMFF